VPRSRGPGPDQGAFGGNDGGPGVLVRNSWSTGIRRLCVHVVVYMYMCMCICVARRLYGYGSAPSVAFVGSRDVLVAVATTTAMPAHGSMVTCAGHKRIVVSEAAVQAPAYLYFIHRFLCAVLDWQCASPPGGAILVFVPGAVRPPSCLWVGKHGQACPCSRPAIVALALPPTPGAG